MGNTNLESAKYKMLMGGPIIEEVSSSVIWEEGVSWKPASTRADTDPIQMEI